MITVKRVNTFNSEKLKSDKHALLERANKLLELINAKCILAKINAGKPEFGECISDIAAATIELKGIDGNIAAIINVLDFYDYSE